ncbi:MAG: hypothetical protein NVS4B7_02010 [Ktedonobacteraceae bacterium]
MNCSSCGANLPPGAAVCPVCGTPTPYNVAGAGSGSSQQYEPTVVTPQPQYGGSPPTAYGAPPYGVPPPPDPYNSSANPYGAPVQPNQYGAPSSQQGYGQYIQPGQAGTYGGGMQAPPPKRRSRVGLIIGIVAAVLVLGCVGVCGALYVIGKNTVSNVQLTATAVAATQSASNNVTPTTNGATPTTTNTTPTTSTSGAPSGLSIDPTAAGYITNPNLSTAIDSNYNPTNPTTTFKVNQVIYATFRVEASAPDGYLTGKWYSDGKYAFSSKVLQSHAGGGLGYLAARYNVPTNATVELYFCMQSNCSDAKLAQVVNFTVTASSMQSTGQSVAMNMPFNRPE